ncbi:MAG: type II toxin-antitoxin system VapC family toxin [Blastocatellia bacterium]|nr:type II toxin-antitoxin system VapC family toxin [Blastocatellia bacterium]
MNVSAAVQNVSRLFLDTAPVVYLVEKNPEYLSRVKAIFAGIDNGRLEAVTSPVTLAECLVFPIRHDQVKLQQDFIDVIVYGPNTSFAEIDQQTGEIAAQLRAKHNLRLPDALQIAAAIQNDCDAFLTNDTGLKRVRELRILVIDELEDS